MNKGELAQEILKDYEHEALEKTNALQAKKPGADAVPAEVNKKNVEKIVNAVFEKIGVALENGEEVTILGFGTFSTRKRAARVGRNPRTKEEIQIPESIAPVLKPGKQLKARVQKRLK